MAGVGSFQQGQHFSVRRRFNDFVALADMLKVR
jgi:hypothetical protein